MQNAVPAEINFIKNSTERYWLTGNTDVSNVVHEPHVIDITDARSSTEQPRLDREGFALLKCPTAITNFRDAGQVDRLYAGEICRFIKQLTGADSVVPVGSHLLRFGESAGEKNDAVTIAPGRQAHSDVSDASAQTFIKAHPPEENRPIRRAAQHNIWRAFSTPPQDVPLTLCDARSVDKNDMIVADYYSDPNMRDKLAFEVLMVRYNPAQRWFFYSNMKADEVLVFKRHDTDTSQPKYVPHSAFSHPHATPQWTPRASIEFRTIAYWYE